MEADSRQCRVDLGDRHRVRRTRQAVVTLAADDGPSGASGVATTEYRIDGGDWATYDGPVLVDGDNPPRDVVFEYRSTDANGNVEATNTQPFTPVGKHDD